jgi:hypothetical protein
MAKNENPKKNIQDIYKAGSYYGTISIKDLQ